MRYVLALLLALSGCQDAVIHETKTLALVPPDALLVCPALSMPPITSKTTQAGAAAWVIGLDGAYRTCRASNGELRAWLDQAVRTTDGTTSPQAPKTDPAQ